VRGGYFIALSLILATTCFSKEKPLSIYQLSPVADGTIIGITTLGSIIPLTLNSHLISPKCPCSTGDVNAFDRVAIGNDSHLAGTISDVSVGVAVLGPPLLDLALLGATQPYLQDLVVYAEVLSVSGALVTTAKYTAQRPIPLVYTSTDPNLLKAPNSYASFYSGHTTLAFAALSAAAMTAHYRYQVDIVPWVIVTALGGSIAYERVAAGRHFPTDVIVGAMTGTLEGVLIPLFHSKRDTRTSVQIISPQNSIGLSIKTVF
jgi:membrane-associated phospholipid phosphatase